VEGVVRGKEEGGGELQKVMHPTWGGWCECVGEGFRIEGKYEQGEKSLRGFLGV
jgi:hypothetical protein